MEILFHYIYSWVVWSNVRLSNLQFTCMGESEKLDGNFCCYCRYHLGKQYFLLIAGGAYVHYNAYMSKTSNDMIFTMFCTILQPPKIQIHTETNDKL